jgi:hypothetical protein
MLPCCRLMKDGDVSCIAHIVLYDDYALRFLITQTLQSDCEDVANQHHELNITP